MNNMDERCTPSAVNSACWKGWQWILTLSCLLELELFGGWGQGYRFASPGRGPRAWPRAQGKLCPKNQIGFLGQFELVNTPADLRHQFSFHR